MAGTGVNGSTKKNYNPNFAEFLAVLGLFWIDFPNLLQKDPSFGKLGHMVNLLTPVQSFLPNMHFLDILVVFRLNLNQISFNLVENAFATRQLALLATSIAFYNSLAQACTEIKILRQFLEEKVTHIF